MSINNSAKPIYDFNPADYDDPKKAFSALQMMLNLTSRDQITIAMQLDDIADHLDGG